jgi:hypothetical protein
MQTRNKALIVGLQFVLLGAVLVAVLNFQSILDWYALQTYKPAADVAQIEKRLLLTSYATAIFYRNSPQIDTKMAFNTNCATGAGTLELGCYFRGSIYVLQIDNASLKPEMDVVTAHELLHAAWMRLGETERNKLSTELQTAYAGIQDSELRSRMADYAKSEPGEEANELHSILGTEYANLSPSLEAYYRRYFVNRATLIAAHQQYQNVFNSRRNELERELSTIRELKNQLTALNRQMSGYRSTGLISSYNALVPRQNALVDNINNRIDTYSTGVAEYNALSRSLDSRMITDTESSVSK